MTDQIDFYILSNADQQVKMQFACRIVQKAYDQGLKVYLQTENAEHCDQVNEMLWTFSQGSFIPHTICSDNSQDWNDFPVQLGLESDVNLDADLLINLVSRPPRSFQAFHRIADLVGDEPADKAAGRDRFRFYREQGIEPKTHTIS